MTIVHNLRHHNRERVLRILAHGSSLSRPDIATSLGLSKVTTTSIVNNLIEEGLVTETVKLVGGTGRPAGLVELHPNAGTVSGLDVQAHSLRLLNGNLTANIVAQPSEHPVDTPAQVTNVVLETLERVRQTHPHGPLRHVVIAVPAPVTPSGEVSHPTRLPKLEASRLRTWAERHGVGLRFENDVKLAAVAEFESGAAKDQHDFALLSERDGGVALGLYLGGRLYRGDSGRAGELALIGWPHANTLSSLEDLPVDAREMVLAQVCSAIAVALDLSLFLVHQNAGGAAALDIAQRVREFVLRPVSVVASRFGDSGTVRGAFLQAAQMAQDQLFTTV